MTYNEASNIARCLESVKGLGEEVFVLDSFSTDRTMEIARSYNARIEQHVFQGYTDQRQRLIEMATHDFILMLDADEYLSPELKASVVGAISSWTCDAYFCNRKNKIGDTWIHHGSWYPDAKIRLFDRRRVRLVGVDIHEKIIPAEGASVCHLKGDLMHLAEKNISGRLQKIERYSTRAAEGLYTDGRKWALWRMCIKPCVRFIKSYVFQLGFLDGYYGWVIAKSEAQYVWMREVKLWEAWKRKDAV
jgi:glycosyltransferase involved in cell wall biosynthesis